MKSFWMLLFTLSFSAHAGQWVVIDPEVQLQIKKSYGRVKYLSDAEVLDLTFEIHSSLHRCGGFMAFDSFEEASTSIEQKPDEVAAYEVDTDLFLIDQQPMVESMMKEVSEPHIRNMVVELSAYPNRLYNSESGKASVEFIHDRWVDLTQHRSDIKVEYYQHTKWIQPSLIMTILGSENPEEIVILGGHADSIAHDSKISPGADDNASGIATITEVIRIMMNQNFKPKKTIQFMAYAAEEVGLLGSTAIAKSYEREDKQVIGVMQLDMTLFRGTKSKDIVLMKDFTSKVQNAFLGRLMDEYLKIKWGYSSCGYGCSDHASWTNSGFPASFAAESKFSDMNKFIHTSHDTLERSGGTAEHAINYAKLSLSFLVELAN